MRVNVYTEELTDRVESDEKGGRTYLRFYLELPATVNGQDYHGPFKHEAGDDDSAAVTFWGPPERLHSLLLNAIEELEDVHPQLKDSTGG